MSDELLTVDQAADRLQMSVATVRRMLRDGKLPGRKLGPRQWRIPVLAITQFVDAAMRLGIKDHPVQKRGKKTT